MSRHISPKEAVALLGHHVRVFAGAVGLQDQIMAEGKVIAFIDGPAIIVEDGYGKQGTWPISLPIEEIERDTLRLIGNSDADVELLCDERACDKGGEPIAYYSPHGANPYEGRPVLTCRSIDALMYVAEQHRKIHRPTHNEGQTP